MEKVDDLLSKIRGLMKENNFDVLIIPHSDPHDNEYLAPSDERLAFISGFTGSNGIAIITQTEALCWTDGRYYIQCEKELKQGWKMMKMERGMKNSRGYICDTVNKGSKVAVDYSQISSETFDSWVSQLKDYVLVNDTNNLVDRLWEAKPNYKVDQVLIHEFKYHGEKCEEKFLKLYNTVKSKNEVDSKKLGFLLVKLDDIAWLTNLRGQDIDYNPVFFSYCILYYDLDLNKFECHLFSDKRKFNSEEVQAHLKNNNITLFSYEDLFKRVKGFGDLNEEDKSKYSEYLLVVDETSINQNVFQIIQSQEIYKFKKISTNCAEFTKYIKNDTEIRGFKDCHVRDGAALVRYFAWLEDQIVNKNQQINEFDAAKKSAVFRAEGKLFMGESFECISSTGSNAAIIHYKPDNTNSSIIDKDKVYLCDSGAQYLDGTTDTTRTLYLNDSSSNGLKKEKEMYTRVLIGNLSIERSQFKKRWNLSGTSIDALARHSLWHAKEDYNHGTGHGVGHFLNVHEGPNGIGGYPGNPSFIKNMVMSNEPGYYLEGSFGIRIENIIYVDEVDEDKDYFKFVNFTTVPYEKNLLDLNLLSNDYIDYINKYHEECRFKLLPLLEEYQDYIAIEYLKKKTAPIPKFEIK